MTTNVLGLDMSSTSTGTCLNGKCKTITATGDALARAQTMRTEIAPIVAEADLIVIESIATRFTQTAIAISYVHALILDRITTSTSATVLPVTPAELKKFATGKGNADKDQMLLAAVRAGSPCNNNDEADAWWLWALGQHLTDQHVVSATQYRTQIVEQLTAAT